MLVRFSGISGSTATIVATGENDPSLPRASCFCSVTHNTGLVQ
jgi:hypothetical protein